MPTLDAIGDLSLAEAQRTTQEVLAKADDGELFIEKRQSESLVFDDGKLKSAASDDGQGFGLRAVSGETAAYAHSSDLSPAALRRAGETVETILRHGRSRNVSAAPQRSNRKLYGDFNPADVLDFADKVALLQKVDAFTRGLDTRVRQVSVSIGTDFQDVTIVRPDGELFRDIRDRKSVV